MLFFIALFIVDRGYGLVCKSLTVHAKGGTTYHYYYTTEKTSEDIILMGSSRMSRHYNPYIIEDSLSMSVYNTGVKGNGIILNYGLLCEILKRYNPKLIVYDIFSFDMYDDDRFAQDNIRYLDNLKEHYDNPEIQDIFAKVCPEEKLKMLSYIYRYNSKLPRLIGDVVHPTEKYDRGYNPYHGTMDYSTVADDDRDDMQMVDSLKIYYFEQFIHKLQRNHIPLIVSASPRYGTSPDNHYNDPIKSLCQKYNVPFIDYYSDSRFTNTPQYFHDSNHLNDAGADEFTRLFVKQIKTLTDED